MSLFGRRAGRSNSPKSANAKYLPTPGLDPSKGSTDAAVNAARETEGMRGRMLHDELQKSKSAGIKP